MSVGTVVDIVREPLLRRIAELEDFIRMEVRKMEMQANIMRDAQRTGGWEGAEKVAMAFERAAIRHKEMLSTWEAEAMSVVCNICGGSFHGAGPDDAWGHNITRCAASVPPKLRKRIAELEDALREVVRDVNDYEEANKLSPNPGRTECWDSVAHAKAVLTAA